LLAQHGKDADIAFRNTRELTTLVEALLGVGAVAVTPTIIAALLDASILDALPRRRAGLRIAGSCLGALPCYALLPSRTVGVVAAGPSRWCTAAVVAAFPGVAVASVSAVDAAADDAARWDHAAPLATAVIAAGARRQVGAATVAAITILG
jgi:hypothetical protein